MQAKVTDAGRRLKWVDIFGQWAAVEADLQDAGVDLDDTQLLAVRSWRWLRVRLVGLTTNPTTRTARALHHGKG